MKEIGGAGEASLVADAIPTDVKHLEGSVGVEDDGVIDAALIKITFTAGGGEDERGVFVWSPIRSCRVGGGHREMRRNRGGGTDDRGIAQEATTSRVHG